LGLLQGKAPTPGLYGGLYGGDTDRVYRVLLVPGSEAGACGKPPYELRWNFGLQRTVLGYQEAGLFTKYRPPSELLPISGELTSVQALLGIELQFVNTGATRALQAILQCAPVRIIAPSLQFCRSARRSFRLGS
jgi:hypothetical protein